MSVLKQTVVAGGVVYPAGTAATPELVEKIPFRFWDAPSGDATTMEAATADEARDPEPHAENAATDAILEVDEPPKSPMAPKRTRRTKPKTAQA